MDPLSTCLLFKQFLVERRYLRHVTPSTLEWYETAFKALQKILGADVPRLSKSNLQAFVVAIRQRRVKQGIVQHLHQGDECILFVAAQRRASR